MKIIYFTKYTQAGPSSRYRSYQYFPFFEQAGISVSVHPFFDDAYISSLYTTGRRSVLGLIPRMIRRFFQVLLLKDYDVLVIEYELFPYTPLWVEKLALVGKKRIIFDYDDAIFHNYDRPGNTLVNWLCRDKIFKLVQKAAAVITGSPYLTEKLAPFAKRVVEIPTSIPFKKYEDALPAESNSATVKKPFRIGWIGSKTTSPNILLVKPALLQLQKEFDIELVLIGFYKPLLPQLEGLRYTALPWEEHTEISTMKTFDAGIMPLERNDFNNGKCGFKLIQYMACGLPTISTPLAANVKIDHGAGNLFASTTEEWEACFRQLITHADGFKMDTGNKNREIIREQYSTEANWSKYLSVFRQVAGTTTYKEQ